MFTELTGIIVYIWFIINGSILTVEGARTCPDSYEEMSGRCLRVVSTQNRWMDAHIDCNMTGGRLASVLSDNDPVKTAASQITGATSVWIGLTKMSTDWHYSSVSGDDRFIESQCCYLDSNIHGEFITRTGTGGHYTPSLCMQECREQGSRYAGVLRWNRADLHNIPECRCSHSFTADRSKLAPCNWRCPNNSTSSYCGNDFNDDKSRNVHISLMVFRLDQLYSSFVAWQRDQPDNNYHGNRSPYQSCVALNIVDRSTFGWTDENCAHTTFWTGQLTKRYGHLCRYEMSTQEQCENAGRQYIANRCLSVHIFSAKTWYTARRSCLDAGGDLLRVDNASVLNALVSYLPPSTRWWIDGRSELWHWDDGRQLDRYINWVPGRPANDSNICAAMSSHSAWQWTEENCNSVYPYICETDVYTTTTERKPATPTFTTSTTTSATTTELLSSTTTDKPFTPPRTVSSSLRTPGPPTVTSDDSLLMVNTTDAPPSSRAQKLTTGVISSLVITIVVVLLTTARMLASCCWDKTQRDDLFN